ncbi:MAG: protein kinase [Planctomycetaceae bacterium]
MSGTDKTQIQDDDERERARLLSLQGSEPPAEIAGYSVIRRLGNGAYGTVWLAREDRTGRMVAIKYYPHRRGLNWSLLNREVEKLATLYASRNIVRLLDVGWNAEPPYYVMEFVENGSLGAYLAGGPPGVEESVRIIRQVCGALIEAHGAGVLHCDLKPDNVLLDSRYQVRLCDFGQSRMSHEQSPSLGTLYYMAPEQAGLDAVPDARWDVYAVGALLYHMLTGQAPYRQHDIQKRLEAASSLNERLRIYREHIQTSPEPREHHSVRGVDRRLARIVDQCLAVDPRKRLPNAQAVLSLLAEREQSRARRPLLMLGVIGPLLLLGAMVPIFFGAMRRNIAEMQRQLIDGVQERNSLMAGTQANLLQKELESRLWELERIVADRDFVEAMTQVMARPSDDVVQEMLNQHELPLNERPSWMQVLDRAQEAANRHNQNRGTSLDTSWFLNDATGRQLWRRSFNASTVGENYHWRDYFNGLDVHYTRESAPKKIEPLKTPRVSFPYISEATNRYMVALSVPIRSADGTIIGVFARTLHLGELQQTLGQTIQGDHSVSASRVIALADRRENESQLLDHRWLTSEIFQGRTVDEVEQTFNKLKLPESIVKQINAELNSVPKGNEADPATRPSANRQIRIRDDDYVDPVGTLDIASAKEYSVDWMAAVSTMKSGSMPWLVIVQEKKKEVLAPVEVMTDRAQRQVLYAIAASLATMAAVWLFVWHALDKAQQDSPDVRNRSTDSAPDAASGGNAPPPSDGNVS